MNDHVLSSPSWYSYCVPRCFRGHISPEEKMIATGKLALSDEPQTQITTGKRKTGGWTAISFILGNETFERLASFGLLANFMVYLMTVLHMEQVSASNILNVWYGVSNFAPLGGAFVSDAFIGRFWTIGISSFFSLFGMVTVTLTSIIPKLHPAACTKQEVDSNLCKGPTQSQLGVLLLGLALLSIGSGGIRPCSIPFGVDQFDPTTENGRRGINSFFNWYYYTFTIVILITQTVVVYIQDKLSWVVGFAIPTALMALSIAAFFAGAGLYSHAKPEESVFTSMARVIVAAYKKRRVEIIGAEKGGEWGTVLVYDPPVKGNVLGKLARTNEYRCLDKAAVITAESDLAPDGSPANKWRLCSIQQVEELKCVLRVIPIWFCGMISFIPLIQQLTFTVSQAMKMDRSIGPHFQIPAASISIFMLLATGAFLPIYDRLLVPSLRRRTGHVAGVTLLQRVGVGLAFSALSMLVAGFVEKARRGAEPSRMSVFWLAPQLVVLGLSDTFSAIGLIEIFNRQVPEHMRSVGNALFSCAIGAASYASALLVNVVHGVTAGVGGRPSWLANDLNAGRYDYFYFLLAGLGCLNIVYFLYIAKTYQYKGSVDLGLAEGIKGVDDYIDAKTVKSSSN